MGDRKPTRAIEGGGIRTGLYRRWPDEKILTEHVTSITIPGALDDEGNQGPAVTGALVDGQADELIRQLAYIRGWQVTRG